MSFKTAGFCVYKTEPFNKSNDPLKPAAILTIADKKGLEKHFRIKSSEIKT